MTPLVSILIPCRNAAPWLGPCLDSALAQTWSRCEVIVADDGSTDASAAIAARSADRGVVLLRGDPAGASAARNRALAASSGEFLQFLDADDLLHPDKIRLQMELLARSHAGCVALSSVVHFADGADPRQGLLEEGWPLRNADDPAEWLLDLHGTGGRRGMVQTAQWLTPRATAEAAGPWDEALTLDDDGDFFSRVALASRGLRFARGSIVWFRKHRSGGNLSSLGHRSTAHLQSGLRSLQLRSARLLEVRSDRIARRAFAGSFSSLAVAAYPLHPSVYRAARAEVRRLGGPFQVPDLGRRSNWLRRVLGWRLARRLSLWVNKGSIHQARTTS